MNRAFRTDPHPGRPKILFVGIGNSSHTHSFVDLLEGTTLNVRFFSLPGGNPPPDWKVRAYESCPAGQRPDPAWRSRLYATRPWARAPKRAYARFLAGGTALEENWLARLISTWRPDIIHTLGLEPASYFYQRARHRHRLQGIGAWVVQARGGPDLALNRLLPEYLPKIQSVLRECDQLIADNTQNYEYALRLGLPESRRSTLGVVPGTGGVDVDALRGARSVPASRSRMVLWPKCFECPQSKALPVYEAMKIAWDRIQPCEFMLLAVHAETRLWFQTLPEGIRRACTLADRIPRDQNLALMARARVMLAPSLSDGIPNSLYEAMACGAAPIVSPLDTITPVVENNRHVLFARNLFPHEVADALIVAMTNDALVDRLARENLTRVRQIADRRPIIERVTAYYEELAARVAGRP